MASRLGVSRLVFQVTDVPKGGADAAPSGGINKVKINRTRDSVFMVKDEVDRPTQACVPEGWINSFHRRVNAVGGTFLNDEWLAAKKLLLRGRSRIS